jgi:hypothetical protein
MGVYMCTTVAHIEAFLIRVQDLLWRANKYSGTCDTAQKNELVQELYRFLLNVRPRLLRLIGDMTEEEDAGVYRRPPIGG